MFEIILLLIIAGITGGIGRSIVGFKRGGCIISIVVGFIGAYIGTCLLYTSDAADERSSVDLGGRRIIKKKKQIDLESLDVI